MSNVVHDGTPLDPKDDLMERGAWLRYLRVLERRDHEERAERNKLENTNQDGMDDDDDKDVTADLILVYSLPSRTRILSYDRYLKHQRYYDDLKHIDYDFISYTPASCDRNESSLLIEQDKALGKGGICWDAAFILGEYLVETIAQNEWETGKKISTNTHICELGAGTGLCGLLLARSLNSMANKSNKNIPQCSYNICLTDLPELMPLLQRNVKRNTAFRLSGHNELCILPNDILSSVVVTSSTLTWGDRDAENRHGSFDWVIAADVVASLYDPIALARCLHHLAHRNSHIVLSFKERLSTVHRLFEQEMRTLFDRLRIIEPRRSDGTFVSRNHNTEIKIIWATMKK